MNNNLKSRLHARKYSKCIKTWHEASTLGLTYCSWESNQGRTKWGGGLGGQFAPLEIRQSDYNALISVISALPEIGETISALPPLFKNSRYGTANQRIIQK